MQAKDKQKAIEIV